MAEPTEQQEKNKLWEFFDTVKTDLSWLRNKVKESINSFLWKEIFEVTTQTKQELKKLEEEILKIDKSKLEDNDILETVEWKTDNENTILWLLVKNNKDVKNWFDRIKDIDDEDTVSREIENILLMVKELSNNDTDSLKWDLTDTELKQIWTIAKNKMDLCDNVLKSDEIKDLPEDKKTKKDILKIYNDLLAENNWDASKVKKEDIINKLKTQAQTEQPSE